MEKIHVHSLWGSGEFSSEELPRFMSVAVGEFVDPSQRARMLDVSDFGLESANSPTTMM